MPPVRGGEDDVGVGSGVRVDADDMRVLVCDEGHAGLLPRREPCWFPARGEPLRGGSLTIHSQVTGWTTFYQAIAADELAPAPLPAANESDECHAAGPDR